MASGDDPFNSLTPKGKTVDIQSYSDLKDKYEVLQQTFKTTILEKQQYEFEIGRQGDLIEHLESEHSQRTDIGDTSPMLASSLHSMNAALEQSDTMREAAMDKNIEYKQLTDKLKNENENLKVQNKRLHDAIEDMHNERHQKTLEFQHKIQGLNQRVQQMESQEATIYEKYEEKVNLYDVLKTAIEKEVRKNLETETQMERSRVSPDDNGSILHRYQRTISIPQHEYTSDLTLQHETNLEEEGRSGSTGVGMPQIQEDQSCYVTSTSPMYNRMHSAQQKQWDMEIDKMHAETQKKDKEIKTLKTFNAKLKSENRNLLKHRRRGACQPCVGMGWFK